MLIREDNLCEPQVAALLRAHLDFTALQSPPETVHALDLDALRAPEITFWTVWRETDLLGCGALKALDETHGEVKSMHTVERARGQGIAGRLLQHMINEAQQRTYERLSLETGTADAFAPARALYRRFGFQPCPPFADYVDTRHNFFMTLDLAD